jgi:multiple sugar transport system substrate-binding protein
MRKFTVLAIAIALVGVAVACGGTAATATPAPTSEQAAAAPTTAAATATSETAGQAVTINFWNAPNPPQGVFWTNAAKAYMAEHPNVTINVSDMPESPSSEAGIQAAIAGGTAPAGSENVFIGFGETLESSQAIVPLDQMPGWEDVIKARHMEKTIEGWKFPDGHYYVLPMYTNAMLVGWRSDILKDIGYDNPPTTFSDVVAMGKKLQEKYPDKFVWANANLTVDTWWQRWFDFFILYDAASNGQPLISGNQITADDKAAIDVLTFLQNLEQNKDLLTQTATNPFETGISVMGMIGPWTFSSWAQQFPELKYGETYTLTVPMVPDSHSMGQPIDTFADAKGIVIYAQAKPEEQQAMWDFYKWVLSDEKNDLAWFQQTNLPPARDDLSTNDAFQGIFERNPELVPYAAEIPNAVPPSSGSHYTDVQVSLGDEAVIPVVTGKKSPEEAWNDWKVAAESIINQ